MKVNNIRLSPEFVKPSREKFNEMGFKTVAIEGSHFFLRKFPKRWRRANNCLVDGDGNIRGIFDDPENTVNILTRYKVTQKISKNGKKIKIGFGTGERFIQRPETANINDQRKIIELYQMALDYGDMFYPNWQDPSAYWEKKKPIEKIKSFFRRKIK